MGMAAEWIVIEKQRSQKVALPRKGAEKASTIALRNSPRRVCVRSKLDSLQQRYVNLGSL